MNSFVFVIKAFLMGILPFYRIDFPVELLPTKMDYAEYRQGHLFKKAEVDTLYLKNLMKTEKNGWRYDFTTYAPGRLFSAPKFRVNCLSDFMIVNYEVDDKNWVQISKKITAVPCPPVQFTEK